jgi:hypothetical protein
MAYSQFTLSGRHTATFLEKITPIPHYWRVIYKNTGTSIIKYQTGCGTAEFS